MVTLKTDAEKHCAALISGWLRKKPRSYQVAAVNFLAEVIKFSNEQDKGKS